jgi:hypothetical protein
VLAAVLIGILLLALAITAIIFLPFNSVNLSQTNSVAAEAGVNRLSVNFQADIAEVNIIPHRLDGNLVFLNVSTTGSTGIFGSTNPVRVIFTNATANDTAIVTASVSRVNGPFSFNLHVTCDLYIDPSANLSLAASSTVGKIAMDAETPMTLESLNLEATTGSVAVTLGRGVIIAGDTSVKTTTGSVQLSMDRVDVTRNVTVNAQSTTGSVAVDVTERQQFGGNVTLNAQTTTGSVNLAMTISDNVGARVESHTNFGSITPNVQHFSGNQSPIESSNYPAGNNFLVNLSTSTGSIHIDATYEPGNLS